MDRCDQCDNGTETQWAFCAWCGCPLSEDGSQLSDELERLRDVIRRIHAREWPAGDHKKGARHAAEMWALADWEMQTMPGPAQTGGRP